MNLARQCSRFDRCSVANCPLAIGYPGHFTHPSDKEKRCTMEKQVRQRISAQFPGVLKLDGLTVREAGGNKAFASTTTADKIRIANKGKETFARLREVKQLKA